MVNVLSEIDVPSLLVGAGAGIAGADLLVSTLFAGVSVLAAGGGVVALGWAIKQYENA